MSGAPARLRFGAFLAPFHEPEESPTLSLERDLELIGWLDGLGFDEAWVGEHHSTGWEIIGCPELFLAVAAERTRHIRLGTGAVSLPYHHPLMVADRILLLDHLSRGRIMFGVGPGGHLSDALMLELDPALLRERMGESLDAIMRLFTDPSPLTVDAGWFRMRDAVLQLRPYQDPHPPVAVTSMESPAGMALAGRHGAGVLQLAVAKGPRGPIDLRAHWAIAEEAAAAAGRTVSRVDWRLVVPLHLAETRQRARDEVRAGAARWLAEYVEGTTGRPRPVAGPAERVVDQMVEQAGWIVGTPEDAVEALEGLLERSGGFGALLVWGQEWAGREATRRSYELLARHVAPRFQGALRGLQASGAVARAQADVIQRERVAGVEGAQAAYERARARSGVPT